MMQSVVACSERFLSLQIKTKEARAAGELEYRGLYPHNMLAHPRARSVSVRLIGPKNRALTVVPIQLPVPVSAVILRLERRIPLPAKHFDEAAEVCRLPDPPNQTRMCQARYGITLYEYLKKKKRGNRR